MSKSAVKEKELALELEEAIQIAQEIEHLEATIKDKKQQLKEFVDQNGSFIAGDKIWGYSETVSWKFRGTALKELATVIALEGENPWEILSLPSTAIKKLGWDEDFLSQYGEKKVTKRFSSKKA